MKTLRILKERERHAYITGNVVLAYLLRQLIDEINRKEHDDE